MAKPKIVTLASVRLNPKNSLYHSILIKNLGVDKARKALLASRLSYAMDMQTYRQVMRYAPKHLPAS